MKREDGYFKEGIVLVGAPGAKTQDMKLARLCGVANNCWDGDQKMVRIQSIPSPEEARDLERKAWFGEDNIGIIKQKMIIKKLSAQKIFDFLFDQAKATAKQ